MTPRLITYLKEHKAAAFVAVLLAVGTILAGIGLMTSSGYLISRSAERPMIVDLFVVTAAVRFFGISRAVVRYFERVVSHDLTFKILLRIRTSFYERLNTFSQKWLMSKRPGELLTGMISDIETIQNVYLRILAPVIVSVVVCSITFALLMLINTMLAVAVLAIFVVNGLVVPALALHLAHGTGKAERLAQGKMKVFLMEKIQGLHDSLWLDDSKTIKHAFSNIQKDIDRVQHNNAATSGLVESLNSLLANLAVLVSLLLTIPLVLNGDLRGVMLAALVLGVFSSFEALQGLATAFVRYDVFKEASASLTSLTEPGYSSQKHKKPAGQKPGEHPCIAFRNVSFSYDNDKKVVKDISFDRNEDTEARRHIHNLVVNDISFDHNEDTEARGHVHNLAVKDISFDHNEDTEARRHVHNLAVKDISFDRNEDTEVRGHVHNLAVKDISFDLKPGQRTAIVGPTGSGKSTLVNLLAGFWEPVKGEILADDKPIGQLDLNAYRALFGVVSQDTYIFNSSVRENLLIADANASDQQLQKLLRDVGLDFLASKLDLLLGSQGMKLSGGERQLFALARALLKRSTIWVLDELSANMDATTERMVLDKLWNTIGNRTVLIITHRLVDMDRMDHIIVLNEGRIIEKGDHIGLLADKGMYAKMFAQQMELIVE